MYVVKVKQNKMAGSKTNKGKSASPSKRTSIRRREQRDNNRSISRKGKQITAKQKLILYLNEALSIENIGVQRLQSRIKQTKIENAKQRLQLHLEETREQQDRLKQLISDLGGGKVAATKDKAQLPIPTPPKSIAKIAGKMMTPAELELKGAKEDAVVENTEIILYDMLIRMAQLMKVEEAISVLTQNLSEESSMAEWIKINTPEMITQLWPEIETSVVISEEEEQQLR
jgi:ferritin-like metal-binding protein YciE